MSVEESPGGPAQESLGGPVEAPPGPPARLPAFAPQHFRVASSCGEKQPRIIDLLRIGVRTNGASLSPNGCRRTDPERGA